MRIRTNWNLTTLLVRLHKGAATLENDLAVPQKVKQELAHDPATLHLVTYPREQKNTCPHKILHINVYSSIIHNGKK